MYGKHIIIGGILAGLLCLSACSDDELGTIDRMDVNRFEFPQGSNSWDKEIEQIAKDWGMFIIYKDYTKDDLNKTWLFNRYNPMYEGDLPSEDEVPVYLEIMKKWILSTYDKEDDNDRSQLPVYFYFVNNYHDNNNNKIRLNLGGFDYWSLSFTTEELSNGLAPEAEHGVACSFGYKAIKSSFESGDYVIPSDFTQMTDYESSIGSEYISFEEWKANNPDKDDSWYTRYVYAYQRDPDNVYYKRGFLPDIKETFDGETGYPRWMPLIGQEWQTSTTKQERVQNDFFNYVRFAMSYPETKVYELYPVDGEDESMNVANQLILDKYHFVVKCMKDSYQVDLVSYAGILEHEK